MQFGAQLTRSPEWSGIPENGLLRPLLRPLRQKRCFYFVVRPTMDSARSDRKPASRVEAMSLLVVQSMFISMASK